MTEACYVCDGSAELTRGPREVRLADQVVTVEAEFMRCRDCGELYYLPGQMREIQRAAAEQVRVFDGLLPPSEILAFRERYGLSQAALEQLIHAGPKTVGRWERGTVCQSGSADTLLRLLIDNPTLVAKLAKERGVPIRGAVPAAATTARFPIGQRVVLTGTFAPMHAGTLDDVIAEYSSIPEPAFPESPFFSGGMQWRQ
jgi:HTH-type transcriptional regulator/antitoxin MqsA